MSRLNNSSVNLRKLKTPTILKSLELVKTDITMTDMTPIVDIRAASPKFPKNDNPVESAITLIPNLVVQF